MIFFKFFVLFFNPFSGFGEFAVGDYFPDVGAGRPGFSVY